MLIDVFGIVIPGFCLIVLALAGLVVPLIDLGKELGGSLEHIDGMHALAVGKTNTLLITLLFFSFVVGHLLYRQDPKRPDFRSIKRCWNKIKESGCVRSPQTDCWEYPYGHLEAYLKDRGFTELVETVTWPGEPFTKPPLERTEEEKSKVRKRSKHFINRIKLSVKHANSRLLLPLLVLILALVVRYTITILPLPASSRDCFCTPSVASDEGGERRECSGRSNVSRALKARPDGAAKRGVRVAIARRTGDNTESRPPLTPQSASQPPPPARSGCRNTGWRRWPSGRAG